MLYSGLILGLVSSLHCIGMCGPIAMMLPVDYKNPTKKAIQIFSYHIGRITTYSLIGFLFALAGRGLYLAGIQQNLSIVLGVLMILYVLIPSSIVNKFSTNNILMKPFFRLRYLLGAEFKKKTIHSFFMIGFMNGFLPCGMLYMALFGALSMQSISQGFLYMIMFGLGTIPLMSVVIYFSNLINNKVRSRIQKIIPIVILVIGLMLIIRGLGLDLAFLSPSNLSLFIKGEPICK